ncbi:MAG: tRNA (N(6)-L-threonylcarbamoyladenosine(37)-C(2))-methylthiotransferase MtaB [Alphaproteobacteria bacterium]|nr:tRNA (N(6)-L-threonylcarbamoyladenosine(37)-C(2))-methylthiotransferase MtaB [Alphaproteobacteria bacterium]
MSAPEIVTFGCRLNAYESEVMRDHARAGGIDNAIIFNTCAVTGEAVRQARQAIRKARRDHPDAEIIVTGCAAQIEPDTFANMPEVSRIVGNAEKTKAETFLKGSNAPRVAVADIMDVRETAGHLITGFEARARAFVEVQNGCDHRCTFCVIPYGRGNSRSVAAGEVVTQIRQLVENGTQEIVLTGVDLTSWGGDLPGTPPLGNLVQRILKLVPELPRLRLSSIDSIEADPDLMRAIADEERLMPHLHLSLQHGHDMILKRMKRRHSRADAIAFCDEARRLRPEIAFGADIMAGFPTETDEMHTANLSLIDACGLTHVHVFPYSPRPMTPAAKMPPVDGPTIKARAAELRARGTQALAASLDTHVGHSVRLLAERETEGHTDDFASIRLTHAVTPGSIIEAQVTGRDGTTLIATPKVSAAA